MQAIHVGASHAAMQVDAVVQACRQELVAAGKHVTYEAVAAMARDRFSSSMRQDWNTVAGESTALLTLMALDQRISAMIMAYTSGRYALQHLMLR